MDKTGSVTFFSEDGEQIEFFVLEQTMIAGINYILVTEDPEDEEAFVYIMKEDPEEEKEGFGSYHMVEDEVELISVSKVFEQLLEDIDITVE